MRVFSIFVVIEGGESSLEVRTQCRAVVVCEAGVIGAVDMCVVVGEVGYFLGALYAGGGAVEAVQRLYGEA